MNKYSITNINELNNLAPLIWQEIKNYNIILLNGNMGAGKTTLVSSLLKHQGVKDPVSSPTYSLVNEYHHPNGEIYFHFDFYRINSLNEAHDMGVEEYLYSGKKCFIEWAEKIEQLIPDNFITINIETEANIRYISIVN